AGALVVPLYAATPRRGAATGDGIAPSGVRGPELEAIEVAAISNGVVHTRVRDVVVQRTQAMGMRALEVSLHAGNQQHVVLAAQGDLTPVAFQANPCLATEQPPALLVGAGAGVETGFQCE